ncbi:MAG TPA: 6-phosphogluconolactonase [Mycobacteriales bacterium]|jgi:6-phosphogluconolactonase|nr:6-phosphogluconolactonase [Mycobacteriales bacterium]
MTEKLVVVHRDAMLLAQAVAARIITAISDAQAARGTASIVLTGGGIGGATLRELAAAPARDAIDWSSLDIWWGDERFLPAGNPERNETQAREALLAHVPLDLARVHPMASSTGAYGDDLDAAAQAYAGELDEPSFDILLLGMGPDGHVASLFPNSPALQDDRTVIPVRGASKPPPTRISLGLSAINRAREVWLIAAGEEKAAAVKTALSEGPVPAARVAGSEATRWLLDRAAASAIS